MSGLPATGLDQRAQNLARFAVAGVGRAYFPSSVMTGETVGAACSITSRTVTLRPELVPRRAEVRRVRTREPERTRE